MSIQKINWWKINSFWVLLNLARLWFYNFTEIALTILTIFSLLELVIAVAYWKQLKIIFWIALLANIFAIYKMFSRLTSSSLQNADWMTVISIVLFLGLAKQELFKK